MARVVLGPFNRVEGDLEVTLEVGDGVVLDAHVTAPLYRGFEALLLGRDPLDALVIAPRICGICSVSQSVAAARALADAAGLEPPANGLLATNILLACENLADHLTHFYLFFMPDFTRPEYAGRDWQPQAQRRFAAFGAGSEPGEAGRAATAARTRWLEMMGTLAGRWPHSGALLPGGTARAMDRADCVRLLPRVREMREFLERRVFGTPLEDLLSVADARGLQAWAARAQGSDFALFLEIAADTDLATLGRGPGRYLSYGAYPLPAGGHAFAAGSWSEAQAATAPLDSSAITEDTCSSWLAQSQPTHPDAAQTLPDADKAGAYSWNKAPRLAGEVVETGAIARQLAAAQPLVRDAVARFGGTVLTRVLARLVETARIVILMEDWLLSMQPEGPFSAAMPPLHQGAGAGLTEAARGALGHWLRVERGRIAGYQIVAPTSWNFSPRDSAGRAGALEMALRGARVHSDVRGRGDTAAVQHIVRSFDPCMACTVH